MNAYLNDIPDILKQIKELSDKIWYAEQEVEYDSDNDPDPLPTRLEITLSDAYDKSEELISELQDAVKLLDGYNAIREGDYD